MTEYELPDNFEELRVWVENKEKEDVERRQEMPELAKLLEKQRKIEQELRAHLNKVARERQDIEERQARIRKASRDDELAIAQAKRKLETFASEKAIADRIEAEAALFDQNTAGAPWREFAFDHQIKGARQLASARRAILNDKRGLGKTLSSLIWADMIGAKRILIFAPKDVLQNFKREVERWTPHRPVAVIGGMPKMQRDLFLKMLASQEHYLLLLNYEAWRRDPDLLEGLKNLKADTVIVDEAHNIKEKSTSAYQGIKDIIYSPNACDICGSDIKRIRNHRLGTWEYQCTVCLREATKFDQFCSVKNLLEMTGTAFLNRPDDIWTLLHLIDKQQFPSQNAFLQDYCHHDLYTGRWKFRAGGEKALIAKLGYKFLSRDKNTAGVKTMPQIVVPHYIEFDKDLYPDQWRVIEQIKKFDAIVMDAENKIKLDIVGILPQLLRRRQAVTWPAGIKIWERDEEGRKTGRILYEAPATESIKMDKAMEIAEQVINEEGDRLVVFSQFKEALKEFERRFNRLGISTIRYDGDTNDDVANEAQLDFDGKRAPSHPAGTECTPSCVNHPDNDRYTGFPVAEKICPGYKWQVILCHYKKGGVGLNLNAARQCIFLDREWNPGKEDQAMGRIDRLDNFRESIVHTIHLANSIDGFMDNLIDAKKEMIDGFEDTLDDITDQLKASLQDGDLL